MTAGPPVVGLIHATCVALDGRGVLLLGPSGVGKSGLALQLMAFGACLVADDQTEISLRDGHLWAAAPATLRGKIEARGIGILAAEHVRAAPLSLAVDLGQKEVDRLPPNYTITLFGVTLPCLHSYDSAHFPAGILQYLKAGRFA